MVIIGVGEISLVIRAVLEQLSLILDDGKVHDAPTHVFSPLHMAQFVV